MEREHEEAMRVDFAELVRLRDEVFHAEDLGQPASEIDRLADQRYDIDARWLGSPHHEDWRYLHTAYNDWVRAPEATRRFLDWIEHYRDLGHEQVSQVQQRSLEQARELAGETFQVDYERNAPDVARFTPDTPVPVFGAARQRRGIERGR
ncbi:hypothetical protein [Nocardia suismassiliense]|uniref:hypothetical protein n=1 Tax=Nocardia suismassiliense TaxID=2077092 RepID=UPI000D1EB521|nr:hypothetical protein [Nocardia suismassiliense]